MAAQGLGTTGETNPLLSFNVNLSSQEEEDVGELGENGSALNCSFQCPLCNYTANSSASLARHNGAAHKGIRWQRKDCDFITRDKSSLKRHRRNRHEGIRFKCNYCDYDVGQTGNIHLRRFQL